MAVVNYIYGRDDDGRPRAYPPLPKSLKKWKEPRRLMKSGHTWLLRDSLGIPHLTLRSMNKGKTWRTQRVGPDGSPVKGTDGKDIPPTAYSSKSVKTKVQGVTCYKGPGSNSNWVLFAFNPGEDEVSTRLFISIRAFPKSMKKHLRNSKVGCTTKSSNKSETYGLRDPGIGRIRFRQSDEKARTWMTYNVRTGSNTFYVSANTSSVFKGGIVRAVIPANFGELGLKFRLIAFNDYCDSNTWTGPLGNLSPQSQGGVQWAYGSVVQNGAYTGIRGWVPMSALTSESGSPPDPWGSGTFNGLKCPYGPL